MEKPAFFLKYEANINYLTAEEKKIIMHAHSRHVHAVHPQAAAVVIVTYANVVHAHVMRAQTMHSIYICST
jgi:hypothetical protein